MELDRKEWDFITNPNDPEYEKKFERLIRAYVENAYQHKERFPDVKKVAFFRECIQPDNWLYKLPLPEFSGLRGKLELEKTRLKGFINNIDYVNMLKDYLEIYGTSDESYKRFYEAYGRLLSSHKRGLDEEERLKKEKFSSSPMGKLLSSITGAVTGKKFSSRLVNQNDKTKDEGKGDKNHGDGDPEL